MAQYIIQTLDNQNTWRKKKRPPGLLYSSDNIILVLIVVEQMSLWVGLMSRAAETFLFYPPSTFKGIEGAPAR